MEKGFWKNASLHRSWKIGLVLVILFTIIRFYLVLMANKTGSYQFVSFVFITMMLLPFFILSKEGRRQIGLTATFKIKGFFLSILIGLLSASSIYYIMKLFPDNQQAYHYIAKTYNQLPTPLGDQKLTFFLIFSGISMFFSPLGEEFFYRGLIHENFKKDLGDKKATIIDSLAFALVHLAHFGIIYTEHTWIFLPFASLTWVTLLFITCLGFNYARIISGSIWGPVVAHASFNFIMNYYIFYKILP